jgi:hypothetical protein
MKKKKHMASDASLEEVQVEGLDRMIWDMVAGIGGQLFIFEVMPRIYGTLATSTAAGAAQTAEAAAGEEAGALLNAGRYYMFASIAVDMIDPYGFSTTLSRGMINTQLTQMMYLLRDQIQADGSIQKSVEAKYSNASPAKIEAWVAKNTSDILNAGNRVRAYPQPIDKCYSDSQREGLALGRPLTGCDPNYVEYYNEYYSRNNEKYVRESVVDAEFLSTTMNEAADINADKKLNDEKDTYLLFLYVCGGLLMVFIGVFFAILMWSRSRGQ